MSKLTNIGIVDDHDLFRKGLSQLIQSQEKYDVRLEAGSAEELFEKLQADNLPDIILLDLNLPGMNGLEALQRLKTDYSSIAVIIISMYEDTPFMLDAIKKGARGYLLKNAQPKELFEAIDKTSEIGFYANEKLSQALVLGVQDKAAKVYDWNVNLNEMELEVLKDLCQGLTAQEIAERIYRSPRTIEGIKYRLLEKTDSKNAVALVAWAFRHGILE